MNFKDKLMKLTKRQLKILIKEELISLISENTVADPEDEAAKIQMFWYKALKQMKYACDDGKSYQEAGLFTCTEIKIFEQVLQNHPFVKLGKTSAIKNFIKVFKPDSSNLSPENHAPIVKRVVASRSGRRIAKRLKRTVGSP
jgi:hypothetical protein